MSKITETSDGVFIEIDDSGTRTLQPLSDKDRIAELELRIGHIGNALEGAENDCVTLSAEVDRLRSLVGRLQLPATKAISLTLAAQIRHKGYEKARAGAFAEHGLEPGDLKPLEDV